MTVRCVQIIEGIELISFNGKATAFVAIVG